MANNGVTHAEFLRGKPDVGEPWWWLSFADGSLPAGSQFLGACIVRAPGFAVAMYRSHALGCNPGGEVQGGRVDPPPDGYAHRLLSREECEAVDAAYEAQQDGANA